MEGIIGTPPEYKSRRGRKSNFGKVLKKNFTALKQNGVKWETETGGKIKQNGE